MALLMLSRDHLRTIAFVAAYDEDPSGACRHLLKRVAQFSPHFEIDPVASRMAQGDNRDAAAQVKADERHGYLSQRVSRAAA